MARFNEAPVLPEQIEKIKTLLNDKTVNKLWLTFVGLGNSGGSFIEREKAFDAYADARDKFLKLPPLAVEGIQGTNKSKIRVH